MEPEVAKEAVAGAAAPAANAEKSQPWFEPWPAWRQQHRQRLVAAEGVAVEEEVPTIRLRPQLRYRLQRCGENEEVGASSCLTPSMSHGADAEIGQDVDGGGGNGDRADDGWKEQQHWMWIRRQLQRRRRRQQQQRQQ